MSLHSGMLCEFSHAHLWSAGPVEIPTDGTGLRPPQLTPPMSLKEGGPGAGARMDTEIPQVTPQLVLEGHSTHGFMHVKIAEVNPPPQSASLSGARAYSADREVLNGIKSC